MPRFLVTMSHGPETCAFTDPERRERAQQAATGLSGLADQRGVTVHGAFADVVGHTAFLHLEADDVETVNQIVLDTRMFAQNVVDVRLVHEMSEAVELLAEA